MFIGYLIERLQHLGVYYKSEEEFVGHLLSGEVSISVPDFLRYMREYDNREREKKVAPRSPVSYSSRYGIGERVRVFGWLEQDGSPGIAASVTAVHFHLGKVKYDLQLEVPGGRHTRVYNVDSAFVGDYTSAAEVSREE